MTTLEKNKMIEILLEMNKAFRDRGMLGDLHQLLYKYIVLIPENFYKDVINYTEGSDIKTHQKYIKDLINMIEERHNRYRILESKNIPKMFDAEAILENIEISNLYCLLKEADMKLCGLDEDKIQQQYYFSNEFSKVFSFEINTPCTVKDKTKVIET